MAQVNEEAVMAGIYRGIGVAVDGHLVTADESVQSDPISAPLQARDLAGQVVEAAPEGEMPPWRQAITGELLGAAVVARQAAHTINELNLDDVSRVLNDIWKIIDRW